MITCPTVHTIKYNNKMKQELSWFNNELKRDKCSMMHQNYNSRNVHTSRQIKNLNINCLVTRTAISIFICFLIKAWTYNVLVTMSLIKICLIKDRKVKLSLFQIHRIRFYDEVKLNMNQIWIRMVKLKDIQTLMR